MAWDLPGSSCPSVIGTNHIPSLAELDRLKIVLAEPRHDLRRLKLDIARVQSILDGLLSEKERVEKYIDAHQALMSPIRQIPSETLANSYGAC